MAANPETKFIHGFVQSIRRDIAAMRKADPNIVEPWIRKLHGSVSQVNLPDMLILSNRTTYYVEFKYIRRPIRMIDVIGLLSVGQRATLEQIARNGGEALAVIGFEKLGQALVVNLTDNLKADGWLPMTITSIAEVTVGDDNQRKITWMHDGFGHRVVSLDAKGHWAGAYDAIKGGAK